MGKKETQRCELFSNHIVHKCQSLIQNRSKYQQLGQNLLTYYICVKDWESMGPRKDWKDDKRELIHQNT